MDDKIIDSIMLLDTKERMLSEIVVWLRAKGLWEDCKKDLVTKIKSKEETNGSTKTSG